MREMQIKTILKCHQNSYTPQKIQNMTTNAGMDVGEMEHLFTGSGSANLCSLYGNQCGGSWKS